MTEPVEHFKVATTAVAEAAAPAPVPKTDIPKTDAALLRSSPSGESAILVEMKETGFTISTTPQTPEPLPASTANKSGLKIDKQFITPLTKKETPSGVS